MKVVADIIGKNAMDFNGALVAGCEKVYLSKLDTEIWHNICRKLKRPRREAGLFKYHNLKCRTEIQV